MRVLLGHILIQLDWVKQHNVWIVRSAIIVRMVADRSRPFNQCHVLQVYFIMYYVIYEGQHGYVEVTEFCFVLAPFINLILFSIFLGTYNPYMKSGHRLNCRLCDSGRSCPQSGLNHSIAECKPGFYCPNGTIINTQFSCLPGTYTNATDLKRAEECNVCPPSFSCGWATGFPIQPWQPCKAGHYCPTGKCIDLYNRSLST